MQVEVACGNPVRVSRAGAATPRPHSWRGGLFAPQPEVRNRHSPRSGVPVRRVENGDGILHEALARGALILRGRNGQTARCQRQRKHPVCLAPMLERFGWSCGGSDMPAQSRRRSACSGRNLAIDLEDQNAPYPPAYFELDLLVLTCAQKSFAKRGRRGQESVGKVVPILRERERQQLAVIQVLHHHAIVEPDRVVPDGIEQCRGGAVAPLSLPSALSEAGPGSTFRAALTCAV